MRVVFGVESVLRTLFSPQKINLASFGNMVPHVHWHIIPRWQATTGISRACVGQRPSGRCCESPAGEQRRIGAGAVAVALGNDRIRIGLTMNTTVPENFRWIFPIWGAGMDYLSQLPLANPVVAERQLMRFLDGLLMAPPDPGVLLALLEQARAPLCFVEEEMARRYHNKSLPLADEEESYFQQVVLAWRKMGKAYALCARLEEPDAENAQYVDIGCHHPASLPVLHGDGYPRALPRSSRVAAGDLARSARLLRKCRGMGRGLHAGRRCLGKQPAGNALRRCLCITLLLIDIASPYSNSVRNLNLIRRWAGMWAPLVSIHKLSDDLEVPAYVIELMNDAPLHPTAVTDEDAGPDARRLDTTRLGLQISHMLSQLRQRITPSQLGLGRGDFRHVIALLEHLSRPWSQSGFTASIPAFCHGRRGQGCRWIRGHAFLRDRVKEFEQPDSAAAYSRGEFDQYVHLRRTCRAWTKAGHQAANQLSRSMSGR
jgi:hypothetical protein